MTNCRVCNNILIPYVNWLGCRIKLKQKICKNCSIIKDKKYYKQNKGYISIRNKKYCKEHKEQIRCNARKTRSKHKLILNDLKINGCSICGYDKCYEALEFHHVDSNYKKFTIIASNIGRKTSIVIDELNKCILLCSNCHREIHTMNDKHCIINNKLYKG